MNEAKRELIKIADDYNNNLLSLNDVQDILEAMVINYNIDYEELYKSFQTLIRKEN